VESLLSKGAIYKTCHGAGRSHPQDRRRIIEDLPTVHPGQPRHCVKRIQSNASTLNVTIRSHSTQHCRMSCHSCHSYVPFHRSKSGLFSSDTQDKPCFARNLLFAPQHHRYSSRYSSKSVHNGCPAARPTKVSSTQIVRFLIHNTIERPQNLELGI